MTTVPPPPTRTPITDANNRVNENWRRWFELLYDQAGGATVGGAITDGDFTTNGYMVRTSSGSYTNRTLTGTSNEIDVNNGDGTGGVPVFSLSDTIDIGNHTSLEIPNGASPTVDAAGEIAVDTTITDHTGLITYHDGSESLYVIGIPTGNLVTNDGYIIAYNATNNEFEMTSAGAGDMILSSTQTNTGAKTFNSGTFICAGATSGTITVNATAVAGTNTLTLPAATDILIGRDTTDTLTNKTLTSPVLNTGISGTAFLDEDDMSSDSATQVASQQSIKAYVDGKASYRLISTATASASSEITFTGLSSTYAKYVVEIDEMVPQTDNVSLNLQTSTDNGSTYDSGASDYEWSSLSVTNDGTPSADGGGDTADDSILIASPIGNDTNEFTEGTVTIINPSNSSNFTRVNVEARYTRSDGDLSLRLGCGERQSAADVDAIRFYCSSGNISSGTFKLYGVVA